MTTNKPTLQQNPPHDMRVPFHKHTGIDSPLISADNIVGLTKPVQNTFGGLVGISAANNTLPTGWTATYVSSTLQFTITHNLGYANFSIITNAEIGGGGYGVITTLSTTTFQVIFYNSAGTAINPSWFFILTKI